MDTIIVDKLCKKFRRYQILQQHRSVKSLLLQPKRLPSLPRDLRFQLQALHEISFSVPEGTTMGIIGRNGSGKTTLLKVICGIYRANSGYVRVNGRLSTLLGLGIGFHPEFTGRENVFINGLILGLSRREIRERFAAIVDFAEISDFIDAPVRTYSSGMYVRLAFSIAVNVDPDILLLDEVLAVGDADFQKKCKVRMDEFRKQGKTILLVTHDMSTAESWCDRLILLENGCMKTSGNPKEVINAYLNP